MFWLPGQTRDVVAATRRVARLRSHRITCRSTCSSCIRTRRCKEAMARADCQRRRPEAPAPGCRRPTTRRPTCTWRRLSALEPGGLRAVPRSRTSRGPAARAVTTSSTGRVAIGVGSGAARIRPSTAVRWQNVQRGGRVHRVPSPSGRSVAHGRLELDAAGRSEEALFTGLRLTRGIDCAEVFRSIRCRSVDQATASVLARLVEEGLVWRRPRIRAEPAGMLVSNEILDNFVRKCSRAVAGDNHVGRLWLSEVYDRVVPTLSAPAGRRHFMALSVIGRRSAGAAVVASRLSVAAVSAHRRAAGRGHRPHPQADASSSPQTRRSSSG